MIPTRLRFCVANRSCRRVALHRLGLLLLVAIALQAWVFAIGTAHAQSNLPRSLSIDATPNPTTVGATVQVTATPSAGGGNIVYGLVNGSCSLNSATGIPTNPSVGTCNVYATIFPDATYTAAYSAQLTVTFAALTQTITFSSAAPTNAVIGGTPYAVSATATSGLSVSFTSKTPGVCTVSGSSVSFIAAGACTVAGNQSGGNNYGAAEEVTQSFVVGRMSQTIAASATPSSFAFGQTSTLAASGFSGTGAVSYAVVSGPCSVSGTTLSATAAGSCSVTATIAQDANYNAATSAAVTVTVGKAAQTIVASATPSSFAFGQTSTLAASGFSGTGAVSYAVVSGPCSASGTTLSATAAGSCSVTATIAQDANYNAATSAAITVTVGASDQTIAFTSTAPTDAVAGGAAYQVTASATSGLAVVFTSATTSVCAVSGSTVTFLTAGACVIQANQGGNADWSAAPQVTQTVSVGVAATTTLLTVSNSAPILGRAVTLTARVTRTGGSAEPTGSVTFKDGAVTLGVRPLASGVATLTTASLSAGPHSITAVYSGDANYGESASNAVSVAPNRLDPANDPTVRSLITSQVQTVQRIATIQIDTVARRLEALHEDTPGFVNDVALTSPSDVRAYSPAVAARLVTSAGRSPAHDALHRSVRPPVAGKVGMGPNFSIWTSGSISMGVDRIDGVAERTRTTSQSLTLGVDGRLLQNLKAGLAIGGFASSGRFDDFGSRSRVRSLTATAYSSLKVGEGLFIDGLLGYGGVRFRSNRYDTNASGLLSGSRQGRLLFASIGMSWETKAGAVKYAPYARFDVTHAWLGKYAEAGDPNWALSFAGMNVSSRAMVLGMRGQYDIAYGGGTISPTLRVEYRHAFTGRETQSLSYVADPAATYAMNLPGSVSDSITGTIGLMAKGEGNVSGQIEYSAGYALRGGGFSGSALRGTLRIGF